VSRNRSVRTPKQERSRATVDAIVEATAQVVVQDGYAALSTNRIARVAGVSVGTLYQYFRHKEDVVHELVERLAGEMIDAFSDTLRDVVDQEPDSVEDGVAALLDATMAALRVRPELRTRLSQEAPRGGREDFDRVWRQRYTELVRAALYRGSDRVRDADPDLMAYVVVTSAYAVVADAVANRPELLHTDALRNELQRLVVRYLAAEG